MKMYLIHVQSKGNGEKILKVYISIYINPFSFVRYLAENSTIRGEVWKSYDCTDFIYNEDESLQLVVVTCDTGMICFIVRIDKNCP